MKVLDELSEKEIKKIEEAKRMKEFRLQNPDKVKKWASDWNKKNRNEYQKEYRKRQKEKALTGSERF